MYRRRAKMSIYQLPYVELEMPELYNYTKDKKVKYKKLRYGNKQITYKDILKNVDKGIKWIIFNRKEDFSTPLIALGTDKDNNYYLSTFNNRTNAISKCTCEDDLKGVFVKIVNSVIKVDSLKYLSAVLHDIVEDDIINFKEWLCFLYKLKVEFGDKLNFDSLGDSISQQRIFFLFRDSHLLTLEDFISGMITFKKVFPSKSLKLTGAYADDSEYRNWLLLMRDVINYDIMTAEDLEDYLSSLGPYKSLTQFDFKAMGKASKPYGIRQLEFKDVSEARKKMRDILKSCKTNIRAVSFVDGHMPKIYALITDEDEIGETNKLVVKLCELFGHVFNEDNITCVRVERTELLKYFSKYYAEK